MNLGQIELNIYDDMNFNSTPDSAVIRRIRRYINNAQKEILGKKGFQQLRRDVLPVVSVANNPMMTLPQAATKIIIIADRTNNRTLDPGSLADIRARDPGLLFSGGIPDLYAMVNPSAAVSLAPSAASSLFIVSDSASDGSGLAVNIEGITSSGVYRRASVAMNGLTAVNIDSACSTWIIITKFYISGSAVGNVTLREGSGVGTELGRISKGRSFPRYTRIHLSPTPSSAFTYYCDVELHVEDMTNVTDEPFLPEEYHELLVIGAKKREYLKREMASEYNREDVAWTIQLTDMATSLRAFGGVAKGGQRAGKGRQFSQLGPMYSNGS